MKDTQQELEEILKRLLADVDDAMEFAGTMFKSKDMASKTIAQKIYTAIQAINQLYIPVTQCCEDCKRKHNETSM